MRFLHLADIHLDTLFHGRSRYLRERLRQAVFSALSRGVDVALDEEVDALLLAGDLFDGERLSFKSERLLARELDRLAQARIPVFYATGNHDPGQGTAERGRIHWPEHVTVFDGPGPRTVEVHRGSRLVGRITGAGHATPGESRDLSRSFPAGDAPGDRVPAAALLHTQVGGARSEERHEPYAPSELSHLVSSGYDYWALGHVHQRQMLSRVPGVHYPGNIQGRNPRETGPKGGLLVELVPGGGEPGVEFVELAPIRWETLRVTGLEDVRHLDGLIRKVSQAWREERSQDPGRPGTEWVVRVEVGGPTHLHRELRRSEDLETLEVELTSRLEVLHTEVRAGGIRPKVDPAPLLERQDPVGEAIRLVRALADGEEDPLAELGIDPAELAAVEGEDRDVVRRYVEELLASGDQELAARFMDEEKS